MPGEGADPLDELLAVVALEVLPGHQRARVGAIDDQSAVEVVDLMLEGAGRQSAFDLVVLDSFAVQVADADIDVTRHLGAQVGQREAALVDQGDLLAERLDYRVDDHRQRDRRFVRVAGIVVHLRDRDPHGTADLIGGQAGAPGGAHRLDHLVDQGLDLRRGELCGAYLTRSLAEHRVSDREDLEHAHAPAAGP